jgi:hypothetical protein
VIAVGRRVADEAPVADRGPVGGRGTRAVLIRRRPVIGRRALVSLLGARAQVLIVARIGARFLLLAHGDRARARLRAA